MLTADYDKLGLKPGDKILDLGCGFGRHAYEAARRGANVVALDAGRDEVAARRAAGGGGDLVGGPEGLRLRHGRSRPPAP